MNHQNTLHRKLTKVLLFAVILAFELPKVGTTKELHHDDLTAKDIISRMYEVYATSSSYSDSGVVTTVFVSTDSRKRTEVKPFTTAFIRPDRYRYEFREKIQYGGKRRFIIHRRGKVLQTYWDLDKELHLESLDSAVAAATGISSESAITVPAMLLPDEITWRRAIRFHEPKRLEDTTIDTIDCFKIQDLIFGSPTTLWIEKKTFLLRKIYKEQEFKDFRAQTTTLYTPRINGTITEKMLEYKPSK